MDPGRFVPPVLYNLTQLRDSSKQFLTDIRTFGDRFMLFTVAELELDGRL